MLRNAILICAAALFAGSLLLFAIYPPLFAWPLMSGIVLLGTLFERVGYGRAHASRPAGRGWQETAERFVDPESGRVVSVWFDPANGERRYVDDGAAPPAS